MVGAIPARYGWSGGDVLLQTYFAMVRGSEGKRSSDCSCGNQEHAHGHGVTALEMTKWFDTNYHYIVPELTDNQEFRLSVHKPVEHFLEAKALGIHTRPVILGPVTFLKLAKSTVEDFNLVALLPKLLPVYEELLRELANAGSEWVQIDEPALALDLIQNEHAAFELAYQRLATASDAKILLATFFGELGHNLDTALALPITGLHVDLVRGVDQLNNIVAKARLDQHLSLGVIDGHNIWRADLNAIIDRIQPMVEKRGLERIEIAPSCSLLHVPIDLELETGLDAELKNWLAFAAQKIDEIAIIGRALSSGKSTVLAQLKAASEAVAARRTSPKVHSLAVKQRVVAVTGAQKKRNSVFTERCKVQSDKLGLPAPPLTTIGSFPQTPEVRKARAAVNKVEISNAQYESFIQRETEAAIRRQEESGLDVYWYMASSSVTTWFSILASGDVSRLEPITVAWWKYAQSLTDSL